MNQYILPYFPHVIKSDQGCFGDLEKGGKKNRVYILDFHKGHRW